MQNQIGYQKMEGYGLAKNSPSKFKLWRYFREACYATLNPILYGYDLEFWFEGVNSSSHLQKLFVRLGAQICTKGVALARLMLKFVGAGRRGEKQSHVTEAGRWDLLAGWQTRIDWSNVSETGGKKIASKCRHFHFTFGYLRIQQSANKFMRRYPIRAHKQIVTPFLAIKACIS